MLSETVQQEQYILKSNVRVFAFSPGVVDTAMQEHLREVDSSQFNSVERFRDLKKNDELLAPEAVAQKIVKLLNNYQQYTKVVH